MSVDSVYGGLDGIITTSVILSGSLGGGISERSVMMLGVVSLVGGAISMAVSRYLSHDDESEARNTMTAFLVFGSLPLIMYYFSDGSHLATVLMTCVALFMMGVWRETMKTHDSYKKIRAGIRSLIIGGIASIVSYYVGKRLGTSQ